MDATLDARFHRALLEVDQELAAQSACPRLSSLRRQVGQRAVSAPAEGLTGGGGRDLRRDAAELLLRDVPPANDAGSPDGCYGDAAVRGTDGAQTQLGALAPVVATGFRQDTAVDSRAGTVYADH